LDLGRNRISLGAFLILSAVWFFDVSAVLLLGCQVASVPINLPARFVLLTISSF
jgi:hypothetical protein